MTFGRVALLAGIALGVMVVNVAITILYMVVYSYLIDPGHEKAYYDAHVQIAAPYCSIVAGIPLMFLAGLWVAGFWDMELGVQSALIVWLTYAVIDLAILAAAGVTPRMGLLVAVSLLTKLAAIYCGALVGARS
jgi:ABC-type transport system involved in cytochrome c biogenesis permease subunit